ncbi:MAG: hypothetical protein ACRDJW_21050 [Thermomicrobiales bacterium]
MAALEFWARINPDGTLPVPAEVAAQIHEERPVRVIVLLTDPSSEDDAWARLTVEQFLNGYAEGDAVYDAVSAG